MGEEQSGSSTRSGCLALSKFPSIARSRSFFLSLSRFDPHDGEEGTREIDNAETKEDTTAKGIGERTEKEGERWMIGRKSGM